MKDAELRRANDELTSACRLLEEQNQRLRDENKRLRKAAPIEKKEVVAVSAPIPGCIVHYTDKAGHVHNALVLKVLEDNALRLKIFRQAVPDWVLDVRKGKESNQRNCWKGK